MSFDPSPIPGQNQFHPPAVRSQEPTKQELRGALRHPGELPWLIVAALMGLIFYVTAALYALDGLFSWGWFDDFRDSSSAQLMLLVGVTPVMLFFARGMLYAQLRSSGVRMTPTQFPEGYRMVVVAARAAGLPKVPDAYVLSGSGVLNAFASGHGFRRFVTVHSDLFEIGGAARDPQALRFIVSHEVGHLAAGHTSYWRLVAINLFSSIPLLGQFLSRAQEYTADNYGYRICPEGSAGAIKALSGGKYLNSNVNFDEFADRSTHEKGFFVWAANLNSTHPILTWRGQALRDRSKAGSLFLRPKFRPLAPPSLPSGTELDLHPSPAAAIAFLDAFPHQGPPQFGMNFPQPLPGNEIARPEHTGYGNRTLTEDWQTRMAPPLPGQTAHSPQQLGGQGGHSGQTYVQEYGQPQHQESGQQQNSPQQQNSQQHWNSQPDGGQQPYQAPPHQAPQHQAPPEQTSPDQGPHNIPPRDQWHHDPGHPESDQQDRWYGAGDDQNDRRGRDQQW